jgi:FixJ family two-component response regulator
MMPKKPVISIVDDDEAVREGTKDLLTAVGYSVKAFVGADAFLKSRSAGGTSCLIADMRMPGMSGLELHSRLRDAGRRVPTILITAFPDDRTRARAMRAGVTCYLSKPFNEDDLLGCIRKALEPKG